MADTRTTQHLAPAHQIREPALASRAHANRVPTRSWNPNWVVVVAATISAVLLASAVFIHRTVQEASHVAARGQGELFLHAVNWQTRRASAESLALAMHELVQAHYTRGLRHVRLIDGTGETIVRAGRAKGVTPILPSQLIDVGAHMQISQKVPPPPFWLRQYRPTIKDVPSLQPGGSFTVEGAPPFSIESLPPFSFQGRSRVSWLSPRSWLVVLEFEPITARKLQTQATAVLVTAVLADVLILLLAAAFLRALRQGDVLRTALERDRRLAMLGEMSGVLAHEIRNPLASLKGHTQLLSEDCEPGTPLHRTAERVVNEASRIERLIAELLEFIRSGEIRRGPCDVHALINDVIAELSAEAKDAGKVFVVQIAAPLGDFRVDRDRLRHALNNILRNAIQTEAINPEIIISGSVDPARTGLRKLVLTVRDYGAGIAEHNREKIFQPFHTGKTRGIGLGLAVTRRIIELHDGTIQASNHPEGGAVFRIEIPERLEES